MSDAIKDLELIKEVFDKHGVKLILVYGALLGHYRDGKFLPGDDDIDLAVVEPIDHKTRKAIGWMLFDLGFRPQEILFNVYGRMEPQELGYNGDGETGIMAIRRNFNFTLFFFKEEFCEKHGYEYVCIPKLGSIKLISTPTKFFKQFGEIKIGKKKYLTPYPIEEYLSDTYFNNWKDKTDRRHGLTYPDQHK